MKHAGFVALSALFVFGLSSSVGAQAFTEDFEAYAVDSLIDGQGGWETWSGHVASESGVISTDFAKSGSKSMKTTNANDTVRIFPDVRSGCWSFKANVYIPGDHDGTTYFILLNGADRPAPLYDNWDWAVQFTMTGNTISGEGGSRPLVKDAWSLIEVKLDLDNNVCEVYYNGEILRAGRWWANGPAPLGLEAVDLYSESPRGAYWDDVSLQPAASCDFEPADFGPFGHIQKWLILGPLIRPNADCAPNIADSWADYLTDGMDITQDTILPTALMEVDIDYVASARSTGYHATGRRGPDNLPMWIKWYDEDGGINYNDNVWYNDPNNVVAYAVAYVTNTTDKDMVVYVGTGSDDAIEIWQDGVVLNSVQACRGWGWPGSQDVTLTLLEAGVKHRFMTKTFEAGGGFNFYLRFQDAAGNPVTNGIDISLDPAGVPKYPVFEPGQGITRGGWVTDWLNLGELRHRGTNSPSIPNLFKDYLTDGVIDDILVKPADGEEVEVDYCGAAMSGGLDGTAGLADPDADNNGFPEWLQIDGTNWNGLDYSAIFGDINWVMNYAVAYVINPTDKPKTIIIGTTSDDSVISYMNTHATTWANVGRGWSGSPQEYGLATLLPGKNKLLVKTWEEGGGHGMRAKIVNAIVEVTSDPTGCIVPDFGVRRNLPREAQNGANIDITLIGVGVGSGAVTETLPAGWTVVDAAGGTVNGQDITWASLAAGSAITYTARTAAVPAGLVRVNGVYGVVGSPLMDVFGDLLVNTGTPPASANPFGTAGNIRTWLILGPLGDQPGCDVSPAQMNLDYLTDGFDGEMDVYPYAGQEIDIDFDVAESDTYYGRRGATNLPVWYALTDNDGGINYNDEHMPGMQNDNVMAYAVCYVTNTTGADMQVWFGTGSDDALVVWFDDSWTALMDTCRGWGFPNPQEVNGPVTLQAGVQHRIMTKTFEQGGGWNFYLRMQNAAGNPITSGVTISLESELNPPPAIATRKLPQYAATGGTIPVTITVKGSGTVDVVENVPAGWAISNVSAGGSVVGQKITWAGAADGAVLTYEATASDSVRAGVFSGTAIGDTTVSKTRPNDLDPSLMIKDVFGPRWGGFEILDDNNFNIWGSGEDIWGGADEFRYVYQEAEGDFQITARVPYVDRTHDWAKAGVMIRQSGCPNAGYAFMHVTAPNTQGNDFQFRLTPGAGAGNRGPTGGGALVPWVRLVKEGDTITAYRSATGAEGDWTQHGAPITVDWVDPVLVGLAVTSHTRGAVAGAEFRDVEALPLTPPVLFIRGDTDGNGQYIINDGIQILERLFAGRQAFDSNCEETGDVDGNGQLIINDAIWMFNFLFASGPEPAPPANTCGTAPLLLGCDAGVVEACK